MVNNGRKIYTWGMVAAVTPDSSPRMAKQELVWLWLSGLCEHAPYFSGSQQLTAVYGVSVKWLTILAGQVWYGTVSAAHRHISAYVCHSAHWCPDPKVGAD